MERPQFIEPRADIFGSPIEPGDDPMVPMGNLDYIVSPHRLFKEQVEEALGSLTERERKVISLRKGLDDGRSRTQAQVGQEIGRSRWTVGRIERRALRKLRHPSAGV